MQEIGIEKINSQQAQERQETNQRHLPFCVPIPSDSYQFKHIGKY
jgi:hypothetical protein